MPFFRTVNVRANVSIESATDKVPDDGYYYVLRQGKIEARFRRLKQAQELYAEFIAEMNLPSLPKRTETPVTNERMLNETITYMSNKALLGIEKKRKGGRFNGRR